MTRGSLNIKLVEKSLLDLFTDDVLSQLVALMARTLEIPENSTLLRELKRLQRTMTQPSCGIQRTRGGSSSGSR